MRLVSPGPHESIRTDYASFTFALHTDEHEDELTAYWYALAEKVLPTGERPDVRKSRHHDKTLFHPSGVTLEISPKTSQKPTAGTALLTISGGGWGSLDATERRDLIIDIGRWPGFLRCTRWDCQITVLEPPITVEEIIEEVSKGRLWIVRYRTQNTYEQRDKDGLLVGSPTQYFGSRQSDSLVRIYDHAALHGWGCDSLRVENQLRKELADQHFRRLYSRCLAEREKEPLFVTQEELTVKDVLSQHADFRDTSMWAGRPKPRKWAQTAVKPDWWAEILDHSAEPLQRSYKPELAWEASAEAMVEQYGRKVWLDTFHKALMTDMDPVIVFGGRLAQMAGKLKKEDRQLLVESLPPEKAAEAKRLYDEMTAAAAMLEEHLPVD